MSHITFKHTKGTENNLPGHISHLRCMTLYDSLESEGEGKELGHDIFEELHPISVELPIQAEQHEIKIHEIQHVPFTLNQEEIKRYKKQPPDTLNL